MSEVQGLAERFGFRMSPREYGNALRRWLDPDARGWVLKKDAPEEIKRLYDEYMEASRKAKEAGYYID